MEKVNWKGLTSVLSANQMKWVKAGIVPKKEADNKEADECDTPGMPCSISFSGGSISGMCQKDGDSKKNKCNTNILKPS